MENINDPAGETQKFVPRPRPATCTVAVAVKPVGRRLRTAVFLKKSGMYESFEIAQLLLKQCIGTGDHLAI